MSAADRSPRVLESYICGEWRRGGRDGTPLLNAATGQPVALIDASGLDLAAALDFGRETGGPVLRAMTFHQRALMLKELGLKLMAAKEAFHTESLLTGATRADSSIDIDGGLATMLALASRARRDLPNARILPEGPVETRAKTPTTARCAGTVASPISATRSWRYMTCSRWWQRHGRPRRDLRPQSGPSPADACP